jgi:hypothetical protein
MSRVKRSFSGTQQGLTPNLAKKEREKREEFG